MVVPAVSIVYPQLVFLVSSFKRKIYGVIHNKLDAYYDCEYYF